MDNNLNKDLAKTIVALNVCVTIYLTEYFLQIIEKHISLYKQPNFRQLCRHYQCIFFKNIRRRQHSKKSRHTIVQSLLPLDASNAL